MRGVYGLKRIILVDSYRDGIIPFEVGENALINGINGAGKTSLLRLLSLFFGREPSDLDNDSRNKDSSIRYYFPKNGSMIIFEYTRESGDCCVFVRRRADYDQLRYTFAKSGFCPEMIGHYRESDGELVNVPADALTDHWKTLDIEFTRSIDIIKVYRAIIQNDRRTLKSYPEYQALAGQFNLGGYETSMVGIDAVCWAICSNQLNMDQLKQIIANIITSRGKGDLPTSKPLKDSFLSLHPDFRGLKKILELAPDIQELKEKRNLVNDLQASQSSHHQELANRLHGVKQSIAERDQQWSQEKEALDQQQETQNRRQNDVLAQIRSRKSEREQRETWINELKKAHHQYHEADDIQSKIRALASVGVIQSQVEEAQKRLDDLLAASGEASQSIDQRRREMEAAKAGLLSEKALLDERLKSAISEIEGGLKGAASSSSEKRHAIHQEAQKQKSDTQASFFLAEEPLRNAMAEARASMRNPALPEAEKTAHAQRVAEQKSADEALEQAYANQRETGEQLRVAKETHETLLSERNNRQQRVERATEQLKALEERLHPKSNTLLARMNELEPGWPLTIGKILNPELLQRTNLNPAYRPDHDGTIMGWSLDLEALPDSGYAEDHDTLEKEYRTQVDLLDTLTQSLKNLEKDLLASAKTRKDAESQAGLVDHEVKKAQKTKQLAVLAVEQSESDCQSSLRRQAEHFKKQVDNLDRQISDLSQNLAEKLKAVDTWLNAEVSAIQQEYETVRSGLEEQRQQATSRHQMAVSGLDERIRQLDSDFAAYCKENGVEEALLKQAQANLNERKNALRVTESYRQKVSEYRLWEKESWSRLPHYEAEVRSFSEEIRKLDIERKEILDHIKTIEVDRNQKRTRFQTERASLDQQKGLLDHLAETLRQAYGDLPEANEQACTSAPHATWADAVRADFSKLSSTRAELHKQFKRSVAQIEQVSSDTIRKAWSNRSEGIRSYRMDDVPDHVQIVEDFWEQDLALIQQSLVVSLKGFRIEVSHFYDSLRLTARHIRAANHEINEAIQKSLCIKSIEDFQFDISPNVNEGSHLSRIKDFLDAWKESELDHSHSLGHPGTSASADPMPDDRLLRKLESCIGAMKDMPQRKSLTDAFSVSIKATENNREVHIRTSRDMETASSTGLRSLMVYIMFVVLGRMICADRRVALHWPVDEIGKLDSTNIIHFIDMLEANQMIILSGQPETKDQKVLRRFPERYLMTKEGIKRLPKSPMEAMMERVAARVSGKIAGENQS